jgi:hypothetical protein
MKKIRYVLALTTVLSVAWGASLAAAEPTNAMPARLGSWLSQEEMIANPDIVVRVDFHLDRNGQITGPLKVRGSGQNPTALKKAIHGAQRAVRQGAPYKLPQDKYELWKNAHFVFHADPNWKAHQ